LYLLYFSDHSNFNTINILEKRGVEGLYIVCDTFYLIIIKRLNGDNYTKRVIWWQYQINVILVKLFIYLGTTQPFPLNHDNFSVDFNWGPNQTIFIGNYINIFGITFIIYNDIGYF